jgi:hypothetical protein
MLAGGEKVEREHPFGYAAEAVCPIYIDILSPP